MSSDGRVTINEAIRRYGLPRPVVLRLEANGALLTSPGPRGSRLIELADLDRLVNAPTGRCSVCGDPLLPGRRSHGGRCGGIELAEWLHSPGGDEAREKIASATRKRVVELRRYAESEGLVLLQDLAARLNRSRGSIARLARLLGRDERAPIGLGPGGPIVFTPEGASRIERAVRESPTTRELHADPRRRGGWYYARFGSTKLYGQLAKAIVEEEGGQGPGLPEHHERRKLTEEKRKRILRLREQGHSQRAIAYMTGLSRGSVEHVLRHQEVA